jgi:hypothetical protein
VFLAVRILDLVGPGDDLGAIQVLSLLLKVNILY